MSTPPAARPNPWFWVPSLYFAQGIPYVLVMTVSVAMYKRLGISNTDIALYTSWLYLPWVIKPLWAPVVDLLGTKRRWVVAMQAAVAVLLAGVALTLPADRFFQYTIALFWLMAFASSTHDIAADGFYMLGLAQHQQAAYVGIRSTFYRVAMIAGEGGLVFFAGELELASDGRIARAWSITFWVVTIAFLAAFLYHAFILPRPAADRPAAGTGGGFRRRFFEVMLAFFRKDQIIVVILFLLFYRFAEAQLVKLIAPFLLDARENGGLGLTTSQLGIAKGFVGVVALLAGGILGGVLISRHGLRHWLWPMMIIMHAPDLAFVYLSYAMPESFPVICAAVAVEQFGYGFGFTAYMMFMIMAAEGEHKTAHYALCTGFMALGMMLPGMFSGWLQEQLGYPHFFLWVVISTIPGFMVGALVRIDPKFARKT